MHRDQCLRLVEAYVGAFNGHDLDRLRRTLHAAVTLDDWEIKAEGQEAVLAATRKVLESPGGKITAYVERVMVEADGRGAAAEMTISSNGRPVLAIVDVFRFSEDGLINSIKAYRGAELS